MDIQQFNVFVFLELWFSNLEIYLYVFNSHHHNHIIGHTETNLFIFAQTYHKWQNMQISDIQILVHSS